MVYITMDIGRIRERYPVVIYRWLLMRLLSVVILVSQRVIEHGVTSSEGHQNCSGLTNINNTLLSLRINNCK